MVLIRSITDTIKNNNTLFSGIFESSDFIVDVKTSSLQVRTSPIQETSLKIFWSCIHSLPETGVDRES